MNLTKRSPLNFRYEMNYILNKELFRLKIVVFSLLKCVESVLLTD